MNGGPGRTTKLLGEYWVKMSSLTFAGASVYIISEKVVELKDRSCKKDNLAVTILPNSYQ